MAAIDEYNGVCGYMRFDGRWDNIAPIVYAEYRQGCWHYFPPPKAKPPQTAEK
jgi:hypothetical protein